MRLKTLLLFSLSLTGCGYSASRDAHLAQISMIGMSAADLLACAGPASKSTRINDGVHIDTYAYTPPSNGGVTLNLPLDLGGVAVGGAGNACTANVRVVNNTVTEVHYTGPDDTPVGSDGVCAPIFRGCVRQPEATMRPVIGTDYDAASAYHAPPVPPQTGQAEDVRTTVTTTPGTDTAGKK